MQSSLFKLQQINNNKFLDLLEIYAEEKYVHTKLYVLCSDIKFPRSEN